MNTLERAATRKWLDAETVRSLLIYDPNTGVFTWRKRANVTVTARSWNSRNAGNHAGSVSTLGYVRIRLFGKAWLAHRLAWLYMTGEWPPGEVDHVDRDKANNRWKNLRAASPSQNQYNKVLRPSKSGFRGVCFHRQSGRWQARIKVAGKKISLGYHPTAEAAAAAYDLAARKHHGNFGVTNAA